MLPLKIIDTHRGKKGGGAFITGTFNPLKGKRVLTFDVCVAFESKIQTAGKLIYHIYELIDRGNQDKSFHPISFFSA